MKNIFLFFSMALISAQVFSQTEKVTCHQLHNAVKPTPLTDYQKVLLNESNLRSDTFNILNYNINIDITDYAGQYIDAHTIIDVRPKMNDVTEINLDLFELSVDSLKIDGLEASYTYDNELLSITLNSPSVIDEDFQIEVWYNGNPHQDSQWGGFYFQSNYIYNLGIGLSTIPPSFGKVWYPCFDTFVERATYDYHVLSDDGFIPRCQGLLMSEEQLEGDTILSYYRMPIPIPTYLSAIAASDYETIAWTHDGAYGPIEIELQSRPSQVANMTTRFQNLGEVIDGLEYWFGPYIWNKVGYVMTTVGAMEHPTNIAYPQGMMTLGITSNEQLYSHELGHLWFGDMVSSESYNDMWLKEGHAEYASHLAREWLSGYDAFIDEVKDNQLFVLESAHLDDGGFFPLSPIPDEIIYGRHTYYKGAATIHSLRGYVGDSLFRSGLQGVLDTFYLGYMNPEQYQSAFENTTGVDLSDFMEDLVYTPGFSTFVLDSATTVPVGDEFLTTFHIKQKLREAPDLHSNVPLDFTLLDAQWVKHSYNEMVTGEYSTVEIYSDFEPLFVMLNGEDRLNQARLAYDAVLFEQTNTVTLPWVDFKLKVEEIGDTAFYRAEHHWVGPDQELMSDDILELSDTHYWTVSGLMSEGIDLVGRISFHGFSESQLDYNLFGDTEVNAGLAYRPGPGEPWSVYPYYTPQLGSDNGNGTIKIDSLLMGEFAFANVEQTVGISEFGLEESHFEVYPNPSSERVFIKTDMTGRYDISLIDSEGRIVAQENAIIDRAGNYSLEIDALSAGTYALHVTSENGRFEEQLSVIKRD